MHEPHTVVLSRARTHGLASGGGCGSQDERGERTVTGTNYQCCLNACEYFCGSNEYTDIKVRPWQKDRTNFGDDLSQRCGERCMVGALEGNGVGRRRTAGPGKETYSRI